ncbi:MULTISPECIES: alpha/beta hydrolase [Falsihalocynthiibacter]|uniref:alpha/beta hydrolase n=1 Tax=Falsihalocynthiibacter TaxID=2854182 RepID=UPI003002950D
MDMDDAYANAKYIPNASNFLEQWEDSAREWREMENAAGRLQVNLSYGAHEREKFDLFLPSGRPEGLMVFVHGGYWYQFDKFRWSHFAEGATARDWAVAIPSYPLAPEARISEITQSIRKAIEEAAKRVRGPIVLAGHSAGGHLVARMLCEDGLAPEIAARIKTVVPISPLSDLRPLMETKMNADLRLDLAEAEAESPLLLQKHVDVPVTVWVGGAERPAFLDQARWLAQAWEGASLHIEPGQHHFNVIDGLKDPESSLMRALF